MLDHPSIIYQKRVSTFENFLPSQSIQGNQDDIFCLLGLNIGLNGEYRQDQAYHVVEFHTASFGFERFVF
jgi:hypothetical protein